VVRLRLLVALLAIAPVAACIDHPEAPTLPPSTFGDTPAAELNGPPAKAPAAPVEPTSMLKEVVYVLMNDYEGGRWMCTGSLVSKDRVITAGHCLDESRFSSWEIVAPLAEGKPRVTGSSPTFFSENYTDISVPDIGFIRLDTPIVLAQYAELTDVSARVDQGARQDALSIVRAAEEFEAPFKSMSDLAIASTIAAGYDHGFATKFFSHGGDSGAGLFLLENGVATHKLVGVLREPEPDQDRDHFTRIDETFTTWLAQH
jgi:hypothetical protein